MGPAVADSIRHTLRAVPLKRRRYRRNQPHAPQHTAHRTPSRPRSSRVHSPPPHTHAHERLADASAWSTQLAARMNTSARNAFGVATCTVGKTASHLTCSRCRRCRRCRRCCRRLQVRQRSNFEFRLDPLFRGGPRVTCQVPDRWRTCSGCNRADLIVDTQHA